MVGFLNPQTMVGLATSTEIQAIADDAEQRLRRAVARLYVQTRPERFDDFRHKAVSWSSSAGPVAQAAQRGQPPVAAPLVQVFH